MDVPGSGHGMRLPVRERNPTMKNVVLTLAVLVLGSAPAQRNRPGLRNCSAESPATILAACPTALAVKYSFPVKNIYAVPLTFIQVRSGCGCLTPVANPSTLQPQQTGTIDITIDTTRFKGPKLFNVFVTVGPEFVSTATLTINAVSRQDVVFNPGQLNFGVVPQGFNPTQTVDVEYAGLLDWRMTEVVKNSAAPFDIVVNEIYRQSPKQGFPGKVGYRLKATLKKDAVPGAIKQELILKTNDPMTPVLTLLVEGNVQATLTVAPSVANLGKTKVGEIKTLKVQVRALGRSAFWAWKEPVRPSKSRCPPLWRPTMC